MEDSIQIPNPQNPSQNSKKRPLENGNIQDSNFFKIRAITRDLRPHFIEVLKTSDFRNCIAAQEIRDKMKLMMDLYKEMMAKTISITRCMNLPETQTGLSGETPETQKLKEGVRAVVDEVMSDYLPEDPQPDDGQPLGTFIVGGSAFGWNFITYPGGKALYYGRTKEIFRAENVVVPDDLPKAE